MRAFKIIFISLIVIVLVLLFGYYTLQGNFSKAINKFQNCAENFAYTSPFKSYFTEHQIFPQNFQDLLSYIQDKPLYLSKKNCFIDPFSNEENLLNYIPLYDSNENVIAYLLISSGPDGKISNDLNEKYYETSFQDHIRFYNTNVEEMGITVYTDTIKFNPLNYFFGTRDYLVSYINGRSYYEKQIREVYSGKEIVNTILENNYRGEKRRLNKQVYAFRIERKEKISTEIEDYDIAYATDKWRIHCELSDSEPYKDSIKRYPIVIFGLLDDVDMETNEITFTGCFIKKPE